MIGRRVTDWIAGAGFTLFAAAVVCIISGGVAAAVDFDSPTKWLWIATGMACFGVGLIVVFIAMVIRSEIESKARKQLGEQP